MFKRNYKRGKRPSNFRRRAPLAHVRRTWIQSRLLDPCSPDIIPLCLPQDSCCTTRFNYVVMTNSVLQSKFSDRAVVKRILANLLFGWDIRLGSDCAENYNRMTAAGGVLYWQLIKRPIDRNGNTELPPEIWDSSSQIDGFSESKALKSGFHYWNPFDNFKLVSGSFSGAQQTYGFQNKLTNCSGDNACFGIVMDTGTGTGGALPTCDDLVTPPVEGICLESDCAACGEFDAGVITDCHQQLSTPHSWNFKLDHRRGIALREDEDLVLDFQFRTFFNLAFTNGSLVGLAGGIKTLVQF